MYTRIDVSNAESLFLPMSRREGGKGVYFVRIAVWNESVRQIVWKFHETAASKGVILEQQISNPDERQLKYLTEVLGSEFLPNPEFVNAALNKWMPRMSESNRREFSEALCRRFNELRRQGKTESILKNIYIKMMCWLYYKFERLMPFLGEDVPPAILYEAPAITQHELMLLRMLGDMGADILLLETRGDGAYLKQDPKSEYSGLLNPGTGAFPEGFTLKAFRKEMMAKMTPRRPEPEKSRTQVNAGAVTTPRKSIDPLQYFHKPAMSVCANVWMKDADVTQILTPVVARGDELQLYYTALIRLKGVRDKLTFLNELYQFYLKFRNTGRSIVVVDDELTIPDPEETAKIRRHNYRSAEEMIVDIAGNLPSHANSELQTAMQRYFAECMLEAAKSEQNISRLMISAVYLLCWIRRYHEKLFRGFKGREIPCFVLMGGCKNKYDALYLKYLSLLPVDILIIAPDLNRPCTFESKSILELSGNESQPVMKFPTDAGSLQLRSVASYAEGDLTDMLYGESGMYRNHQFKRADAVTLQTTYDELFLLWDQELKYRTHFITAEDTVSMPVVYAQVSGVEKGDTLAYWQKIKLTLGKATYLVNHLPMIPAGNINDYQALAVQAIRAGNIRRDVIRNHRNYPFGLLREEMQDHIFDKLQLMLDRKTIRGTFVNGTEYTVLSTVLNMNKDLIRMLQSFDFTQKNPKLVCVGTGDHPASLEDAIMITFLHLVGFDVVLFVPTGYQIFGGYLNDDLPVEHQIGDFVYDLTVPDFATVPAPKPKSWLSSILKRGN